ncbi:polysaccharide pyruvyl transferase family protein [Sphingobium bisphenolivorans]|uniref:polysaccharide pyruvyl transferase family protein n=1 Tax=Sphingobium bisphenolivorans TaxID=1335760 RepID=UPI00039CB2B4|nr:polysaccharide pyruvyl transferase family protein [Sphingobium bisphenolivorans]
MTNEIGHRIVVERQARLLSVQYRGFLNLGHPYALVDFPNHSNVGDSAIWAGELRLLREITGRDPDYVCDIKNYDRDELRYSLPVGPVLIHGGGNFGDIWPRHHEFRLKLMSDFPGRLLVQLPQSIHFNDHQWVRATAEGIAAHGNFHLMVRDAHSHAIAADQLGVEPMLAPDSAFALGPLQQRGGGDKDVMALLRTDSEGVGRSVDALESLPDVLIDDWLIEGRSSRASFRRSQIQSALRLRFSEHERRLDHYNRLADWRVERGLHLLSRGKLVITDRLHAHILSTLMGLPHIALDNNYGKISAYIDAWTHDYAELAVATEMVDAVAKAKRWLDLQTASRDGAAAAA